MTYISIKRLHLKNAIFLFYFDIYMKKCIINIKKDFFKRENYMELNREQSFELEGKTSKELMKKIIWINIENIILTGLVYILFFKFSSNQLDYFSMNIHPLVAVVAMQSLRYGTRYSFSVIIFALFFYMLPYYELGYDMILFFSVYRFYKFIIMFIMVNLFLGRVKNTYIFNMSLLKEENLQQKEDMEKLIIINSELKEVNGILEKRIIKSRESILTLHSIEQALKRSEDKDFFHIGIDFMRDYLHARELEYYLYDSNFNSLDKKYLDELIAKKEPSEYIDEKTQNRNYIAPIFKNGELVVIYHIKKFSHNYRDVYHFDLFQIIVNKIQEIYNQKG